MPGFSCVPRHSLFFLKMNRKHIVDIALIHSELLLNNWRNSE